LGWQHGLQAALSLTVLLVAAGFVALVRELNPGRWALVFLGFPLALSWEFYMGLWAFVVSTGVGLWVIAVAVRWSQPTWRQRGVIALLLLANAVAHVFGAVLTGGVLLLLSAFRARRGARLREAGYVVLTGVPAAGILLACLLVSRGITRLELADKFERFAVRDVLAMLPRTVAPGPLGRGVVVAIVVAVAAAVAAVRVRRPETDATDRGLGAAALLLLLAGVFAPFQVPGWQAFSERFFPLGVALALAVVPLEGLPVRLRRLAPGIVFGASAAWLALSYPFHRRLAQLCPDALAGLRAPVRLSGEIFPVLFRGTELPVHDRINAEVPVMTPLLHMGSLYAAALGGVSTDAFASSPAITPFVYRSRPSYRPRPDLEHYTRALASWAFHRDLAYRRQIDIELASFGMFYDETALFGALPEDLEVWRERGFAADWMQGTAALVHFVPCMIDFAAPAIAGSPGPVVDVRVGKIGLLSGVQVAAELRDDGLAHFRIAPAPCGVVTLHARWPQAHGHPDIQCVNANGEGDLVATITRVSQRVGCDLATAQ